MGSFLCLLFVCFNFLCLLFVCFKLKHGESKTGSLLRWLQVEKWGASSFTASFSISLLWLDFSDVLCRYSLGTNPRGVKELISLSYISYYTLGGWITYYICCYSFVVIHACIIAIVLDMVPSSSSSWSFDICLKVLYYTYTL
jgi:hypothetical protein